MRCGGCVGSRSLRSLRWHFGLATGLLTTVVMFTDASLLRPWRVPDPDALFLIRPMGRSASGLQALRVPEYHVIRERTRTWENLALTVRGETQALEFANGAVANVGSMYTTGNYFDTLGVRLAAGRTFTPAEDSVTAPRRHRHRLPDLAATSAAIRTSSAALSTAQVPRPAFHRCWHRTARVVRRAWTI